MPFNCKIEIRRTRLHIDTTYSVSEHNFVLELLFNELSESSNDNVYFFIFLRKKLLIDKYYTF